MRNQEDVLKDINTIKEQKLKCYIFGAGKIGAGMGKEFVDSLDIVIEGYCDTNPDIHGKIIRDGLYCISCEEIKKIENKACFLMLGQYHKKSGLRIVEQLGFSVIIDYDEVCSLDKVIRGVIGSFNSHETEKEFGKRRNVLQNNPENPKYKVPNPSHKEIAVYTCISGNYDDVTEPQAVAENVDYYLISDNCPKELNIFQWIDIRQVVPEWVEDHPRRNRYCKIMGAEIFSSYKYSIYIDGNIKIVGDIGKYIDKIGACGVATHEHAYTKCLYSEAVKILAALEINKDVIKAQVQGYAKEKMPREFGQYQNGILVRENNNTICRQLMKKWWEEVFVKSHRDQLSFSYCIWKADISKTDIGILGDNIRGNKDFVWVKRHHTGSK